ncbi:MAG: agmatinase [bacterium]
MKRKTNFGDMPLKNLTLEESGIVILPIPYDGTSTWIKGADKGPAAIVEASDALELYDIETDSEVYKKNIFIAEPVMEKSSPEKMVKKVKTAVANLLDKNKFVAALGGEHSISIGAIQAHAEKFPDMSVLQLDAHSDLRDEYHGSKYNHACVMARAREICPIAQVGIRSMDASDKKYFGEGGIFFAENIYNNSVWQDKAISKLTDKVYITIDLDVFDPSVLPSTGTPEPGGLGWYQVLGFLKKVVEEKKVVGFDVVELCPNKNEKSSDFLAAKLIYKLLSYIYVDSRRH